ncbi:hypothetical protein ACBY01_11875 [Sphingomonas sp. ac-8]|uniref:hypothetical protein n=1 Tax=Sphingomonas sp. ac-8 TaxID=3242977 RepID=UPI003A7F98E7
MTVMLDASALIAMIKGERGSAKVADDSAGAPIRSVAALRCCYRCRAASMR